MAKLVAAIASASVPLVLMYHSQSVSDWTSRNNGLFPSARSSMSCRGDAEPLAHPQPMLCVRLLDADVVDQKGARVVVLDLDQPFGQELGKRVDERIDLQNPALHFRHGHAPLRDGL